MLDKERLKTDLLALGLLALVVFVGLSFLSYDPADPPSSLVFPQRQVPTNICGEVGAAVAYYTRQWMGFGMWIILAALVTWDLKLFAREPSRRTVTTLIGLLLLATSSCALLHLLVPGISSGSAYGSGGQIGALSGILLEQKFSTDRRYHLCRQSAGRRHSAHAAFRRIAACTVAAALPVSAIRATSGWLQRSPSPPKAS